MSLVWLTGYSGSGKSTIAEAFHEKTGAPILDGDVVRKSVVEGNVHGIEGQQANKDATTTLALKLLETHELVVAAFVSPNKEIRQKIQNTIEKEGYRYILVHVSTPIEVCKQRDPKGLYQSQVNGEDIRLAGVNVDYDIPINPELTCDSSIATADACAEKIVRYLSLD